MTAYFKFVLLCSKNDNEGDYKAVSLATELKHVVQQAKGLRENLKDLRAILKRIAVCMATKPLQWLQEFHQANGFINIKTILLEAKTKYSAIGNSNAYQSAQYNSLNTTSNFQDSLSNKDTKDLRLTQEIKHECMKILRSFANTPVSFKF